MKQKIAVAFFAVGLLGGLSARGAQLGTHVKGFYDLSPGEQAQVESFEKQQSLFQSLQSVQVPKQDFSKLSKQAQSVIAQDDLQRVADSSQVPGPAQDRASVRSPASVAGQPPLGTVKPPCSFPSLVNGTECAGGNSL
jgi:hypothetical protein